MLPEFTVGFAIHPVIPDINKTKKIENNLVSMNPPLLP
jgi:hypothetical protein